MLLAQVPIDVQNQLFTTYLFKKFLRNFCDSYFRIPYPGNKLAKTSRLMTFDDTMYAQLMKEILLHLEPRYEPKDTIIFETNQEVNEMFFINSGSVDVGFQLNKMTKYCLRL
jgi:hypothetical protein